MMRALLYPKMASLSSERKNEEIFPSPAYMFSLFDDRRAPTKSSMRRS
jgi:hypothetical protein